mmetsp:Transcript_50879/g.143225  ORF Transcript_50879/g.143225 Transcript_50879/m.143225 type:complete len:271 (-) Transcript_50879:172-984(-)
MCALAHRQLSFTSRCPSCTSMALWHRLPRSRLRYCTRCFVLCDCRLRESTTVMEFWTNFTDSITRRALQTILAFSFAVPQSFGRMGWEYEPSNLPGAFRRPMRDLPLFFCDHSFLLLPGHSHLKSCMVGSYPAIFFRWYQYARYTMSLRMGTPNMLLGTMTAPTGGGSSGGNTSSLCTGSSRMLLKPTAGKAHQLRITALTSTMSPGRMTLGGSWMDGFPGACGAVALLPGPVVALTASPGGAAAQNRRQCRRVARPHPVRRAPAGPAPA